MCSNPPDVLRSSFSTRHQSLEIRQLCGFPITMNFLMVLWSTFLQKHFLILCRIGQVPFWRKIMYTDVIVPVPGGVWALKPVSEVSGLKLFYPANTLRPGRYKHNQTAFIKAVKRGRLTEEETLVSARFSKGHPLCVFRGMFFVHIFKICSGPDRWLRNILEMESEEKRHAL